MNRRYLVRLTKGYQTTAVLLLNTLILLICLEMAAWLVLKVLDGQNERQMLHQKINQSYYASQPWAEDYWRDHFQLHPIYRPYVIWRNAPYQGEAIHIDDQGYRVTPEAVCEEDAFTVFVFGGSTVWGHGVPDWGTIPAYLQQELAVQQPELVCVRNFGEMGYVSTQGVIELTQQLQKGQRPDLVIFYDGFNDLAAAFQNGRVGSHLNEAAIGVRLAEEKGFADWLRLTNTYELLTRVATRVGLLPPLTETTKTITPAIADTAVLADIVFQTYFANYQMVAALAETYDFTYYFFWQPTTYSSERTLWPDPSAPLAAFFQRVYAQMDEQAGNYTCLTNLAALFDEYTEAVWLDEVHLTPYGNEAVAQEIARVAQDDDPFSKCHGE